MPKTEVRYITAELNSGEKALIPYWQICADTDGPTFLLLSCQHGNEVNGSETIRRFIHTAKSKLKCGVIFAVPFANVLAMRKRRPHINLGPEQPYSDDQGHNMNRTWPGKADGNDTERLAYAINEAVAKHAMYVLDFHSWARFSATAAIVRKTYLPSKKLAAVSAMRFIHTAVKPKKEPKYSRISDMFSTTGRAGLAIELAGQYGIDEREVRRGVRAANNVAKYLGMLDGEIEGLNEPIFYLDELDLTAVKAPCNGLFVENQLANWDYVTEGQALGHLLSDKTLETVAINAPINGYLRSYGACRDDCDVALPAQHPYAEEGETLAIIGSLKD